MATPKESSAEMISAYLDAELDADEAEAFESMLAESPVVREELEDLQKVLSLMGGLEEIEAPEDFVEKLNRRLRRRQMLQPQTASKFALIALPFQVLSILVILVVAALYMMAELDKKPAALERDPGVSAPKDLDPSSIKP